MISSTVVENSSKKHSDRLFSNLDTYHKRRSTYQFTLSVLYLVYLFFGGGVVIYNALQVQTPLVDTIESKQQHIEEVLTITIYNVIRIGLSGVLVYYFIKVLFTIYMTTFVWNFTQSVSDLSKFIHEGNYNKSELVELKELLTLEVDTTLLDEINSLKTSIERQLILHKEQ